MGYKMKQTLCSLLTAFATHSTYASKYLWHKASTSEVVAKHVP
jgi:hypothetical protein